MRSSALVFLMILYLRRSVAAAKEERRYNPTDLNEAKAKEAFMCIEEVSCVEKKPQELRKIVHAAEESPEVIRDVYEAMLAYGFDFEAYKYDEPWVALSHLICSMPIPERLSRFTDFGATMGLYFEIQGQAFIDKYTELGICNNPRRMAKQGSGTLGQALG